MPSNVHTASLSLKFSVKRASFCPPARNSVGLRNLRVAWLLIMDEISYKKDVLFGFMDEAGVTIYEDSKYEHAIIGITPLINSSLSKSKVPILVCFVPLFGVLYKYYGSSVLGTVFTSFLED